jgi:uncharacterized protein (DUF488 family)
MNRIYTIGTSIHSTDEFCSLLLKHRIDAIADVRSVPYSKYTPQFNKDILVRSLQQVSICYLDFGAEFGARRTEQEAYTDNKVDFEKVVRLPVFLSGVERISTCINKGFNIALMCTEKNPLDCHRFSLLSNPLSKFLDIDIEHILFDGNIITQQSLENELLHDLNLYNDLFISRDELLKSAYDILGAKIAHQEPGQGWYE